MTHYKRSVCRACGGNRLSMFLALGPTPLANSFLASEAEFAAEIAYPLDVYFCETCSLVQLLDVIDPETLFRDYIYVTGTSDTMARHNSEYARAVVERLSLGADDLVVEVASNDGSLLKFFQPYGVRTLGVEPATNIAQVARAAGVDTLNEFFSAALADEMLAQSGPAAVVIANNVLAHVDEPRDFLTGCRRLLRPSGQVIVEVPYLGELLARGEYDTVYHEHLCYFSVTSLLRLCEAVGLSIVHVERVPVHGGSLRVFAGSIDDYSTHSSDALSLVAAETSGGMNSLARYERFARDVEASRETLVELLEALHDQGKRVAGYGAPAKGNTLLNYCRIDTRLVAFTVDKNSLKVGRFTPGAHIPVLPVGVLADQAPDYALILAWNFADEIMAQQSAFQLRGGRFILPIPTPRVV